MPSVSAALPQIVVIDTNRTLIAKVAEALKHLPLDVPVRTVAGDLFDYQGVIVSASNSRFIMGGGLDAAIAARFPETCAKVDPARGNQRIDDIIFTITVDDRLLATRELIRSALAHAFANIRPGETLLLSGLGTGIGRLDADDFVWLLLSALCAWRAIPYGFKYTDAKGHSFARNSETGAAAVYRVGKTTTEPTAIKDGEECGPGLHLGTSLAGAGNYNLPERVFFCTYDTEDRCGSGDDKVRVSTLRTVAELPVHVAWGPAGKQILAGLSAYKADHRTIVHATKLPTVSELRSKLRSELWSKLWSELRSELWSELGSELRSELWSKLGSELWSELGSKLGSELYWQYDWQADCLFYLELARVAGIEVAHWYADFAKLGILVFFVGDRVLFYGRDAAFLGEYPLSKLAGDVPGPAREPQLPT